MDFGRPNVEIGQKMANGPSADKTGFEIQFEALEKASPKERQFTYCIASSFKNKKKNRIMKYLPHVNVSFSQSTYSINEDVGSIQLTLVLSNSLSTDITVQVVDDDNTATGGGVDYNSGPYNVTFPAGMTNVSFVIIINDDNILEDDEFNLTIYPNNITTDSISRATVIIINDDGTTSTATDISTTSANAITATTTTIGVTTTTTASATTAAISTTIAAPAIAAVPTSSSTVNLINTSVAADTTAATKTVHTTTTSVAAPTTSGISAVVTSSSSVNIITTALINPIATTITTTSTATTTTTITTTKTVDTTTTNVAVPTTSGINAVVTSSSSVNIITTVFISPITTTITTTATTTTTITTTKVVESSSTTAITVPINPSSTATTTNSNMSPISTTDPTKPAVSCTSNDDNSIYSSKITTTVLAVLFIISVFCNIIIIIWIAKIPKKILQFKAKLGSESNIQANSMEPLYEVIVVPGDERMENPTYATHSIKMEKNPAYSLINTKDS